MTTKPKSRKATAPMMELAAKIDKATTRYEAARGEGVGVKEALGSLWKLEDKLAGMGAWNLKEMKLKARYIVSIRANRPGAVHALRLAESIVNDLLSERI